MGNKNIPGQITEQDKAACETIQEAYNNALEGLSVLEERVGDMRKFVDKQRVCRMRLPDEKYCADYLGGTLSLFTVQQKKEATHLLFISDIVRWFNATYHLNLKPAAASKVLLPQSPKYQDHPEHDAFRAACNAYQKALNDIRLNYLEILSWITDQLGGLSFDDKAWEDAKRYCQMAAYSCNGFPQYARKNAIISFADMSVYCDADSTWAIKQSKRGIIKGLAAYDTGVPNCVPLEYECMLRNEMNQQSVIVNGAKVKEVKCFKNGRANVRFANARCAEEFELRFLKGDKKYEV